MESITSGIDPNWKILDEQEDEKRWERLNKKAEGLTNDICESWKEELHNLLIFAGLFSAVVTTFTIEAGKTVQGDPTKTTVLLLRIIARQLDNQSHPQANGPIDLMAEPTISLYAQQINLLYSVSLTLSLVAVLGGIVCLQWLREYGKNITGVSHKEDLSLQYQRYKSLRSWGVLGLLNTLPLLLLVSLGLFFTGFMVSQWGSKALAAVPVTCLVAISGIFILATSVLPAMQVIWLTGKSLRSRPPVLCPYRSPQAWLFHQVLRITFTLIRHVSDHYTNSWLEQYNNIRSWMEYDTSTQGRKENGHTVQSLYHALLWISKEYRQTGTTVQDAYFCLILASCRESWTRLKEKYTAGKSLEWKWEWDGLGLLGNFDMDINIMQHLNDDELLRYRSKAVVDVIAEWGRSDHSVNPLLSDILVLQKDIVSHDYLGHVNRKALVADVTNALRNPGNTRMTEESAVAVACHVVGQDSRHWGETIPILKELCKKYQETRSLHPIRTFCDTLRDKLTSEHKCDDLVDIFNIVFPYVDSAHLGDLGPTLGSLLVRCDKCFIPYLFAGSFLNIIEDLASKRLIAKDSALDNIVLYTKYVIERSWGLPNKLLAIEETLDAILSAAEEHVQHSFSTDSVLHPIRLTIPRTILYRHIEYDLEPVWALIDNFNIKLNNIWDGREGLEICDEWSGKVEGNQAHKSMLTLGIYAWKQTATSISKRNTLSRESTCYNSG